jgi:N-acetylneuraminic acid mutarotase
MLMALFFCLLALAQADLDLNNGQWKRLKPTGSPPTNPKIWHTGTSIGGTMYTIGGEQGSTTNYVVETYNPDTNAYGTLPNSQLPTGLTAADMDDVGGMLFVFGGLSSTTNDMLNDVYVLHPTNTSSGWKIIESDEEIPPRNGHTATAIGGEIFVFGGWDQTQYFADLWSFDVSALYLNNSVDWVFTYNFGPSPRNGHSMVAYGGDLYMFGGFWHNISYGTYVDCFDEPCLWYNDMWVYTVMGDKWTQIFPGGELPVPRYGHTATVIGENMYVFGGNSQEALLNDMWAYSFPFNVWQQLKPSGSAPTPRYSALAVSIGEAVYIYGGLAISGTTDTDLYGFYPHVTDDTTDSESSTDTSGLAAAISLNIVLTFFVGVLAVINYRMVNPGSHLSSTSTATYH